MYNQRSNIPIIHTNVSIYEQALMTFHELNPVPEQASQKILKLQFNSTSISVKRNFIQEIPQLIQKNNDIKSEPSTTLRTNQTINNDQMHSEYHLTTSQHHTTTQRKLKLLKNNHVSSTREEDPIIQQLNTLPHKINPPTTQPHSIGGRER